MSASTHIGRIGALAAALGVGAAMLSGPAVAWADRGPSDPTGPSTDAGAGGAASPGMATGSRAHRTGVARTEASDTPSSVTGGPVVDAAPEPAASTVAEEPRRGRGAAGFDQQEAALPSHNNTAPTSSANDVPAAAGSNVVTPAMPAPDTSIPAPAAALAAVEPAAAQPQTSFLDSVKTVAPVALAAPVNIVAPAAVAGTAKDPGIPASLADVADRISTAITAVVSQLAQTFSGTSPFAPPVQSPAEWVLLAAARRQPAAATTTATAAATAATSTGPTLLVLNGYNVVAASQKVVTSFYGPFVNFPAYPGTQSEQSFNLVDPATKTVVGSFKALQSTYTGVGTTRQLVVTDVLSGTAGTAAGQIPPVGSVINASDNLGFGTLYTAMPSPSGNAVSFKIVTPFGSIPIPMPYDAAKGLTDFVEVNKPLLLPGSGYSIAPTTPSTERFTSVTGLQPLFTAIQGLQSYSVYDKNGVAVGSFEGQVTTTSDALGLFTKEIRVSSVGGNPNVHVPPVGTVYNLIGFTDQLYLLYSSSPSATGSVSATTLVTPSGPVNIPLNFDAAVAPPQKPLQVPGGYKLVPASAPLIAGVNGLPPREMITQGYQQFDVVDILGNTIGNVDADVTRQWDWFGGSSDAILVTKVNSGSAGPLPWNVPPVGSVFTSRQQFGINLGFTEFYASIPTVLGDLVTYGSVTPFGFIPLFLPNYLSAGLSDAAFVDPFAVTA